MSFFCHTVQSRTQHPILSSSLLWLLYLWQFLGLSLFFMTLNFWTLLVRYFVECPQCRFVWCFLMIRLKLWFGMGEYHRGKVPFSSTISWVCNINITSWDMLTLITWLRWCLPSHSTLKLLFWGTSLVAQWLRLHAPNTGGPGSIPGQGTRSHMHAANKSSHATTKSLHATAKEPACRN